MNVQYEKQGDYLIPCVTTKEQKEIHLGVWANRHRQYLKQSHKVRYYNLLTSEKLYDYLADRPTEKKSVKTQSTMVKYKKHRRLILHDKGLRTKSWT